jgi:hypothetical protein
MPVTLTVAPSAIADCTKQWIRPAPDRYASGTHYSFGKCLLVVFGDGLDIGRHADSTLLVPTDGAGGLGLR